jgi:hypothetical protein
VSEEVTELKKTGLNITTTKLMETLWLIYVKGEDHFDDNINYN